jgi:bifunctional non-homologous end joining protein LigD
MQRAGILLRQRVPTAECYVSLRRITPMPLARFDAPFEHRDWILSQNWMVFELSPMSMAAPAGWRRNRNVFKTFEPLAQAIAQDLAGRSAISAVMDGEIVRPEPDSRPMFYDLIRRRGPSCFYAFDLLSLDGRDLRDRPLLERKSLLRKLLRPKSVLYVDYDERHGSVPGDLPPRYGGGCRETGKRQVHAGRYDLGQD